MSKDIDTSDLEALDHNDLVYLRDRGFNFPEDFEFPSDTEGDEDYSSWRKADLVAEVERRNEANGEPYLDNSGTVTDLRKVLLADDAGEFTATDEG